ncbi:MAG: hypothetical protein RL701_2126 [Pseudomonadota bacterium]|jgi:hypothetical protein
MPTANTPTPSNLASAFVARIDELAAPDYDAAALAKLRAEISAHLVPIVAGWRAETKPHVVGASKIGGLPDLPDGFVWPKDRGGKASLSFLLQIDLAELAALHTESPLPSAGMLYLFALCDVDSAQAYIMDASYTAVRFSAEPGPLTPRPIPADVPVRGHVDQVPLQFGASLLFERRIEPDPEDLADLDPDDEEYALAQRVGYGSKRFDAGVEKRIRAQLQALGSHWPELTLIKQPWFFQDEAAMQYDPEKQIELLSFFGQTVSLQYRGCVFHLVIGQDQLARAELDTAQVIFENGT